VDWPALDYVVASDLFGRFIPDSLHYENGLTVANGDYVLLHGRFSGMGLPANWIVVDIVRLENGRLAEHWDVIEDEATKEASVSGLPMFGMTFPSGWSGAGVRKWGQHISEDFLTAEIDDVAGSFDQ
jgi:hypothetical protein